ncbi:MAG: glycosyltransferase [Candidatus Latescibacteria bacterium]|nr:glycosyltransferase [Candidatus Latescibacterota bacterium]
MRQVLFLDHHAQIIGGGQLSMMALMKHLRACGPRCLCPGGGGLAAALRKEGIPAEEMDFPPLRPGGVLQIWRTVGQLARRARAAGLLHANSSRAMFYAGLAGRRAKVPVLWHVRIADAEGSWDRFLGRMARCIVVNSQAAQRRFSGSGLEDKVRVIYNGEDLEPFAEAEGGAVRRELGGRPLIGMVGRLSAEKDHETFLQAAARVAGAWPEARFAIVGEDPEPGQRRRRSLEELSARLGLQGRVIFTGGRDDMPALMAAFDLLVHCAHREAFGRVLVEAMAAATPVVATAVGGVPEVVGDCGVLVPEADAAEVARAVEVLLADPETARQLGEAGQRRVRARFSIATHVAQIEALYEEIWASDGT